MPRGAPGVVAVTGASGRLGRAVARALGESGVTVRALAPSATEADALEAAGHDARVAPLEDDVALNRALRGADGLVHCAALVGGPEARVRSVIVEGTSAVLRAARKRAVGRIVQVSSILAIGLTRDPVPIEVDHPWTHRGIPKIPYVLAKREAEERALEATRHGLPLVVACPAALVDGDGPVPPRATSVVETRRAADGIVRLLGSDEVGRRHALVDATPEHPRRRRTLRPRFDPERYEVTGWYCLARPGACDAPTL